ncbi:hypothetical protein BDZ97DRAFT_1922139 [Flammula alnicola]|nr:hypothetical protein BDZ97DRAFT_1922139 [Flammula alnicola]
MSQIHNASPDCHSLALPLLDSAFPGPSGHSRKLPDNRSTTLGVVDRYLQPPPPSSFTSTRALSCPLLVKGRGLSFGGYRWAARGLRDQGEALVEGDPRAYTRRRRTAVRRLLRFERRLHQTTVESALGTSITTPALHHPQAPSAAPAQSPSIHKLPCSNNDTTATAAPIARRQLVRMSEDNHPERVMCTLDSAGATLQVQRQRRRNSGCIASTTTVLRHLRKHGKDIDHEHDDAGTTSHQRPVRGDDEQQFVVSSDSNVVCIRRRSDPCLGPRPRPYTTREPHPLRHLALHARAPCPRPQLPPLALLPPLSGIEHARASRSAVQPLRHIRDRGIRPPRPQPPLRRRRARTTFVLARHGLDDHDDCPAVSMIRNLCHLNPLPPLRQSRAISSSMLAPAATSPHPRPPRPSSPPPASSATPPCPVRAPAGPGGTGEAAAVDDMAAVLIRRRLGAAQLLPVVQLQYSWLCCWDSPTAPRWMKSPTPLARPPRMADVMPGNAGAAPPPSFLPTLRSTSPLHPQRRAAARLPIQLVPPPNAAPPPLLQHLLILPQSNSHHAAAESPGRPELKQR